MKLIRYKPTFQYIDYVFTCANYHKGSNYSSFANKWSWVTGIRSGLPIFGVLEVSTF